jgi:hypothetical protein
MSEVISFGDKVRGKEPVTFERLAQLHATADGLITEYARRVMNLAGASQKEFDDGKALLERMQKDLDTIKSNIDIARSKGEMSSADALNNVEFLASHINTMNRLLGRGEDEQIKRIG